MNQPQTADRDADEPSTIGPVAGEDRTPYAQGVEQGQPDRRAMVRWVLRARSERICHLGLMRSSGASRRFARTNYLLLAVSFGLAVFANAGWRLTWSGPGVDSTSVAPSGRSWAKVFDFDTDAARLIRDVQPSALWWNPPWAAIAGFAAFLGGWLVFMLLGGWIGIGARHAAGGRVGGSRMQCGVQYGSAWASLLSVVVIVEVLRPLSYIAMKMEWSLLSNPVLIDTVAVLGCASVVLLWWFWLLRMAGAAPAVYRGRTRRFFLITAPLSVALLLGSAGYGGYRFLDVLQRRLGMQW